MQLVIFNKKKKKLFIENFNQKIIWICWCFRVPKALSKNSTLYNSQMFLKMQNFIQIIF